MSGGITGHGPIESYESRDKKGRRTEDEGAGGGGNEKPYREKAAPRGPYPLPSTARDGKAFRRVPSVFPLQKMKREGEKGGPRSR